MVGLLMAWYIDDSCISIKPGALSSKVDVDDMAAAPFPNTLGGRFEVPWKRRRVELARWPVGSSVETELWVDGVRVPPSQQGPILGPAVACPTHIKKRTTRRCPKCEAPVCRRCSAADGVRCQACFDAAVRAEHEGRRRGWLIGAAVLLLIALGLFYAGLQSSASWPGKAAGACVFGVAFMIYTAFKRRKTPDTLAAVPLEFAVSQEPPSLVGTSCASCDRRFVTAKEAVWCAKCRRALHPGCRKEHRCRPPKTGPDWDRLAPSAGAP